VDNQRQHSIVRVGTSSTLPSTSVFHFLCPRIFSVCSRNFPNQVMTLPLSKVLKLRVSRSQKVALAAIFTIGIVYSSVEVIRLLYVSLANADDSLSYVRETMLFNPVQGSMAIVIGCLPILRPLFFKKSGNTTAGSSGSRQRRTGMSNSSGTHGTSSSNYKSEDQVQIIKMVQFERTSESGPPSTRDGRRPEEEFGAASPKGPIVF
jgi:hypothetical protein